MDFETLKMHKAWNPYNLGLLPPQAKKNEGKWTKMTKMHCPLLVKRILYRSQYTLYSYTFLHTHVHNAGGNNAQKRNKIKMRNGRVSWAALHIARCLR